MTRRASTSALLAFAAIWVTVSAFVQDGAIAGRVVDGAGEGLPGVTVLATGPALSEPRLEVTDLDGRYRLSGLPPGAYTITITLPGFSSFRTGVDVDAGVAQTVDAELLLGELDIEGTDDEVIISPAPLPGGAVALQCTFHPDGVIDGCSTVYVVGKVVGQLVPR